VAARGLHINRLQYVVNYDFPVTLDQYCHRVGRTGRQGNIGNDDDDDDDDGCDDDI